MTRVAVGAAVLAVCAVAWCATPAAGAGYCSGRNVKQVQEWLGHADPGFTLRTYVHLMDEGVADAEFLDEVVAPLKTRVATSAALDR
jgi:hypothetical protein